MGIVFDLDDDQREALHAVIEELEDALDHDALPDPTVA